jgi:hypothetical protein
MSQQPTRDIGGLHRSYHVAEVARCNTISDQFIDLGAMEDHCSDAFVEG